MFKYIFFFLILFTSCSIFSIKNDTSLISSISETPFLSMRRTACFGQCPTYEISFFQDGKVLYKGKKFVKNEGLYTGTLNVKNIALIQDKIREIDFFNLDSIYDARISDLPSVILEVNMDSQSHKVIDRYKGPQELRDFEKFIDNVILKIESGFIGSDWKIINE